MKKAIVILSGGMDSTTVLYWVALRKHLEIKAISFDYGSKHNKKEIHFAKWHCKQLNIPHQIIKLNLDKILKSNLLKSGGKIPEGHYEDATMKKTVVPFRNGIMLSYAVAIAESEGCESVFLGSHRGDRTIYPDCREEFTTAINLASQLGTYNKVKIVSPFNDLTKREIAIIGKGIGIDYNKTWSCYKGLEKQCGKCGTCVEREEALR